MMAWEFLSLWSGYGIVSVLVVLISVGIISVVYMIGRALQNDKMVAWATEEVYQAFASILIIAMVIFLFGFFTDLSLLLMKAGGFSCSGDTCTYVEYRMKPAAISYDGVYNVTKTCGGVGNACHIAIAQSRVNSMFDIVRFQAADKVARAGWFRLLASISIPLKSPGKFAERFGLSSNTNVGSSMGTTMRNAFGTGAAFMPLAGLVLIIDSYGTIVDTLTKSLQFLMMHNILFTLIEKAIFPLFLVAGIALRSVTPFRKLGGLLIAIAVGLYFIYPLMFILQSLILSPDPSVFPVTFEKFQEDLPTTTATYSDNTQETVSNNIFTGMFNWASRYVDCPTPGAGGQVDTSQCKKVDMITYYLFNFVQPGGDMDTTCFLIVWIVVPELIVIYTVVIFITQLSPFFGGDVGIAGLAKLI